MPHLRTAAAPKKKLDMTQSLSSSSRITKKKKSTDPKKKKTPQASSDDDSMYVILCAICQNEETGNSKCLSAHFKFENEEQYDMKEGDLFDTLGDAFNDWLAQNGYEDWCIDDAIETEKFITREEAVNPIIVTDDMGIGHY